MATLTEQSIWEDGVYQWEKTDVVEGGADGLDNLPIRQLANRTVWLKDAVRGFLDINFVNASKSLSLEDVQQKMVLIDAYSASITVILPNILDSLKGLKVHISAFNVTSQVTVSSTSNNIFIGSGIRNNVYLGDGDVLELVWTGESWFAINLAGNFLTVGKPEFAYSVMANSVIANGQVLNRLDYPRLWEFVSNNNQLMVSDFTWVNSAGYKGFFSVGNNATTFRVPDLRSMFIRGLDIGAGITYGRNIDQPGGYEADAFKRHAHKQGNEGLYDFYNDPNPDPETPNGNIIGPRNFQTGGNISSYIKVLTQKVGSTETRPKNIGLIPLILT